MEPMGNLQGGVQFFSLKSGLIHNYNKNNFRLLPMPDGAKVYVKCMV